MAIVQGGIKLCFTLQRGGNKNISYFYASANEVAGGIMFSGRPSVRPSVPFCFCRYLKNREVVLHQTWYEGISWGDNTLFGF